MVSCQINLVYREITFFQYKTLFSYIPFLSDLKDNFSFIDGAGYTFSPVISSVRIYNNWSGLNLS